MSSIIVFDTSIFIDQLRSGRHQERILALTGLIRSSAVVVSELCRGANTPEERKFLRSIEKNHPVLVPTASNWLESGQLLRRIRVETGFSSEKLRDLHFDLLIALTSRSHGARLITSNRGDFELIARYVPLKLEIWT